MGAVFARFQLRLPAKLESPDTPLMSAHEPYHPLPTGVA